MRSFTPEELVVDVAMQENGLLIYADNHHDGWTVSVDGVPAELLIANVTSKAVFVPRGLPGEHVNGARGVHAAEQRTPTGKKQQPARRAGGRDLGLNLTCVCHSGLEAALSARVDILPPSLAPRGLSLVQAAAYIGVSPSLFDEMVRDGRMPKAKRVIYLHLTGSPPHLDLYDYKPELVKRTGQDCPEQFTKGKRFAFTSGTPKLMGTPRKFAQYGQSGAWLSDAVPHFHAPDIVDEMCFIHSMYTDQFNHAPAQLLMHTGGPRLGRPSMGAWVTYGLGSENNNLPGFVVLTSGGNNPDAGKSVWGSGFLPSVY